MVGVLKFKNMENKTYKINSIKELTTAINKENLNRFLKDFVYIMEDFCEMKDAIKDDKKENFFLDRITWIDDGENNVSFNFKSKLD